MPNDDDHDDHVMIFVETSDFLCWWFVINDDLLIVFETVSIFKKVFGFKNVIFVETVSMPAASHSAFIHATNSLKRLHQHWIQYFTLIDNVTLNRRFRLTWSWTQILQPIGRFIPSQIKLSQLSYPSFDSSTWRTIQLNVSTHHQLLSILHIWSINFCTWCCSLVPPAGSNVRLFAQLLQVTPQALLVHLKSRTFFCVLFFSFSYFIFTFR